MGQFTNQAQSNPLLQMLQGIIASGAPQQGVGMGAPTQPQPSQQPPLDPSGAAQRWTGAYGDRFSPYGNIEIPQGVNTMAFNGLNGQLMGTASSPQAMPNMVDLWNHYMNGGQVQNYTTPTLPPGGGYPVTPPLGVGGPVMPPNPGSQVRPPWIAGPTMPFNPGTGVKPPWIVNQQGPPAGVPQPNNAGPAASSFVGQPIPQQKAINAMNNGNPMKPRKLGVL